MKKTPALRIYIALGANLSHPVYGCPSATLQIALKALPARGIVPVRISRWYRSAPLPASDQPWYVNAVAEIETDLSADTLLAGLHAVEAELGRVRGEPNAARLVDLDLVDYRGETAAGGPGKATLPHPRLGERAFVLKPLADLAPDWRHPTTGRALPDLLAGLPAGQVTEPLEPQPALRFNPKRV